MAEPSSAAVSQAGSIVTVDDASGTPEKLCQFWLKQIELASDQEKDFRLNADKASAVFRAGEQNRSVFNIVYTNIATKVPALYNSTPEPDVRVRDKKGTPQFEVARQAASFMEMGARHQLSSYDFDAVARACVQDQELAGRGVSRVRYKPYFFKDSESKEQVVWEEALCERVQWRQFRRGPGSMWSEVHWVAYELALTRDEIRQLMKPEAKAPYPGAQPIPPTAEEEQLAMKAADEIPLTLTEVQSDDKADRDRREQTVWARGRVWEIWDKDKREVLFISPDYKVAPLRIEPDPLGLLDFFDCAPPMQAISDPDNLVPIVPYEMYREQAEELVEVSVRIINLIRVLKFRGVRAAEIPELDDIDDMQDGEFLVSKGAMALIGGSKGLSDAIWVMPIDILINVIKELIQQREIIKQVIFEIIGIADIMRGASNPNETLGAQQLKANWGSLRVNDQQRTVQRWCRDTLRIKLEVMCNKFSEQTWAMIAGQPIPKPVMDIIRSDIRRRFNIDIETDSTVRGDTARFQENLNQFLQSTAQFVQTFAPLIQSKALPPQMGKVAVIIFSSFARHWKLGKSAEDALAELEEAAAKMPMDQQKEEDKQRQKEADELNKRAAMTKIEGEQAKTEKTRAETQVTLFEAGMAEPKDEVGDFLEKAQKVADFNKTKEEIKNVQADTMAKGVEATVIATTPDHEAGPGFTP